MSTIKLEVPYGFDPFHPEGTREIVAEPAGELFAVHRDLDGLTPPVPPWTGWTVTHRPTGRVVVRRLKTRELARVAARRLKAPAWTGTAVETLSKDRRARKEVAALRRWLLKIRGSKEPEDLRRRLGRVRT